ncbi:MULTISPECIES: DUF2232 domain-containing protein [Shouchella]|uniref:DUF2232 domain-containing protein n=1 Tax=Shouchella hunanensis TaxID=766894 RepID=A0ABY7W8P3_9BACI|nr:MULTISPECIES: DUF2232 domain-containing protein [Shouchella]WDF05302.1 DUF2232 domain-containing protein [Shouchella hunanensis]
MEDKKVVTRGIINGLLFVLLYTLLVTGIPLINTLAFIALPLPLLYITAVYGLKTGTMVASLATVATVGLSLVFSSIILVPVCFALIGVLVGYYQYMRKSAVERIAVFIIAPFLSLAMIYVVIEGLYDVSILGAVRETLVETQRLAESFAVDVYDDAFIREYMQMLQNMMPFLLLVFGTMYGFILYGLSTLMYKRVGIQYDKLPAFRNWQFPKYIIAFYFLFMLLGFISFEQGSLMASISLIGFNIFSIFLLIQGLSFIQTYMYDKKASKAAIVIVTIGLVLLMLVMQLTILFIKIIGLMDLMLRLRDRLKE